MKEQKDWTVMIYMAGDNNLSVDMAYALEELQKKVVFSGNGKINLFVHYNNSSPEIPALYCDFSDFDSPLFQYSTDIFNKFSETNSLDIQNSEAIFPVIDFVDWSVNKAENQYESNVGRKAHNYALIFAGHTMGFLNMGLLKDETTNISMTMPGLLGGLKIITEEVLCQKLSILGFDSCVMSMFEIGQQFEEVSQTMIASEGTIPNAGWSYSEILGSMALGEKDVRKVAGEIVYQYIEKQSNYSIGGVSVDMAAWDLTKLDSLNSKFKKLVKNILDCFVDEKRNIYQQMRRILLQVHFDSQTYLYDQNIDLGDFCFLLTKEISSFKDDSNSELQPEFKAVLESCRSVISEIKNCIILSGFSGGAFQYSNGISLFFPWSIKSYNVSQNDYEQLVFVQKTEGGKLWNQFLQKYLGEVSRRRAIQDYKCNPEVLEFTPFQQNLIANYF